MTVFANNTSATVSSGGTTTSDTTWTIPATGFAGFPTSLATGQSFHIVDVALPTEKIKVTAISGSGPYTWTVVRGDEGSTAASHTGGFTVQQVVTAGDLSNFQQAVLVPAPTGTYATDTANCAAAITAAGVNGTVCFQPGTYQVTGLTPLNYQTWYGPGNAILKWNSGGGSNTSVINSTSGTLTGWTMRGVTIDGGGSGNTTTFQGVVNIQTGTNCKIENVLFTDGPPAAGMLMWGGGTRCVTNNCKFTSVGYGMLIGMDYSQSYACSGNVISGNEFDTTGWDAIYITANLSGTNSALSGSIIGTSITGNVIRSAGDGGIEVGMGAVGTTVSGNTMYGCTNAGIYVDSALGTTVSGNAVYGNNTTNAGINVFVQNGTNTPTTGVTVTGNAVYGCKNGIAAQGFDSVHSVLYSISDINITGNTVYGGFSGATAGIYLYNVNRFTVADNIVTDIGNDGMQFGDYNTPTHACTNGTITGNTVMNSSYGAGSPSWAGIELHQSCADITVSGNRCGDDQVTKTQAYGLKFSYASNNVTVTGNDFTGNATGAVNYNVWTPAASNNVIFDSNLGYNPQVGYANGSGAGGTVTQATSKATAVTLSTPSGKITMNGAALAAGTIVSFTLTNTYIAATDVLILNHVSGGTVGSYTLNAQCAAGSASINVRNNTSGSLSEAIAISFVVIKGATS